MDFTGGAIKLVIHINKHNLKKLANWLVVILYLAIIFTFSNQNGIQSNNVSHEIVREVKEHTPVSEVIPKSIYKLRLDWNLILRKAAHFSEYFILFLLFFRALILGKMRVKKSFIVSLALCIFYALLDEFHQTFILGRTPRITDVMLDTSGAALALILLYFRKVIKSSFCTYYKKLF